MSKFDKSNPKSGFQVFPFLVTFSQTETITCISIFDDQILEKKEKCSLANIQQLLTFQCEQYGFCF